jgi:hypothetical protein
LTAIQELVKPQMRLECTVGMLSVLNRRAKVTLRSLVGIYVADGASLLASTSPSPQGFAKIWSRPAQRRNLGEILSHHLVVYHDETGRDVIKDREATTRAIEFKAKIGKPTLDQPRLPLGGPNKYLGQHFPIPMGMKVEVNSEEGE